MAATAWWLLGTAIGGGGAFAALLYHFLFVRSRPRVRGRVALSGLRGPVEVVRDRWGVPHIYARDETDLAFAQGFVHAQDRLWQMDLNRRIGQGRLAERFGPAALDADRFLRCVGLRRAAEREWLVQDDEAREVLQAYARGVNACLERGPLPVEFRLLGCRPEPWAPVDSLTWAKVMALSLSVNWETELLRALLLQKLGPERAALLERAYRAGHPVIVPPGARWPGGWRRRSAGAGPGGGQPSGESDAAEEASPPGCDPELAAAALRQFRAAAAYLSPGAHGQASNNWVVSGVHTRSGKPLLANDPHLALGMPCIWYEAHLTAGDHQVTGATLPGLPGVVIGHNGEVAWGLTNSFADVQDLYLERFDPANPDRYLFRGEWLQAQTVVEEIRVRGRAEPVREVVRITRHGPVISPAVAEGDWLARAAGRGASGGAGGPVGGGVGGGVRYEHALALRWTGHEPSRIARAVLRLNRARTAAEVREALRDWHTPSQNFVFADRHGHVGYLMAGSVPVRSRGEGLLPVPGWTGEYEWIGTIPFEELPQAFNPPRGLIITANNAAVGPDFPHFISHDWMSGYRAARIEQLLADAPRPLDAAACGAMQSDVLSLPGLELQALVRGLPPPADRWSRRAWELLCDWDGRLDVDSRGGAVYVVMLHALLRRALQPALGELTDAYLSRSFQPLAASHGLLGRVTPVLLELARRRDRAWWDALRDRGAAHGSSPQAAAPGGEGVSGEAAGNGSDPWEEALRGALDDAAGELRRRLGADPDGWRWGRLHRCRLAHALGAVRLLRPLFDRGPFPVPGDNDTVTATGVLPHRPYGAETWAPSYRQVIDLGDPRRSMAVYPGGQSGHPGDRHYADLLPLWRRGAHHPMLWSRVDVERHAAARLQLLPRPESASSSEGGCRFGLGAL